MYVYHFNRRHLALISAVILLILAAAALLAGCFQRSDSTPDNITLSCDADRVQFLESMGWGVDAAPVESLDLELPDPLNDAWSSYAQLQTAQGLPFADYGGCTVQRYTYNVTNYPGIDTGVQANLYLCDDVLIGGDIIFTGQGGFQKDLNYPTADKQ